MNMELSPVFLLLVIAAGSGTANLHIDKVNRMVLRDKSGVKNDLTKIESVPHGSIAVRQLHENILKAESPRSTADPILTVAENLGLTELVKYMVKAKLKGFLEISNVTLFGPTNDAFSNLSEWMKKEISNVTELEGILEYHAIMETIINSKTFKNDMLVQSMQGRNIRINLYTKDNETVATAQCVSIDLSRADEAASNGILHVLNGVMVPPTEDIYGALEACPVFKIMARAMFEGAIELPLHGSYTLFAPTDKAFEKLPPGMIEKIIAKRWTLLQELLHYHLVPTTLCSVGLSSGNVTTVLGRHVTLKVSPDSIFVNNAKVIQADGITMNGVVHAIDTVLFPPGFVPP